MTRKDSKTFWKRFFGFEVGDRVRVCLAKKDQIECKLAHLATGTIVRIYPQESFPFTIAFDDPYIQQNSLHVFKAKELEYLGGKQDEETVQTGKMG